jgi:hypothetical protein
MCSKFYLFEPIMSAMLVILSSAAMAIRLTAIYDQSRAVLIGLSSLLGVEVVVMSVATAFYRRELISG